MRNVLLIMIVVATGAWDCSGSSSPRSSTVDAPVPADVFFIIISGNGSVTGQSENCTASNNVQSGQCASFVLPVVGKNYPFEATPASGWLFDHWEIAVGENEFIYAGSDRTYFFPDGAFTSSVSKVDLKAVFVPGGPDAPLPDAPLPDGPLPDAGGLTASPGCNPGHFPEAPGVDGGVAPNPSCTHACTSLGQCNRQPFGIVAGPPGVVALASIDVLQPGQTPLELVSGIQTSAAMDTSFVYWADSTYNPGGGYDYGARRIALTGGDPVVVSNTHTAGYPPLFEGVAVDETNVYWIETTLILTPSFHADNALMAAAKTGGAATHLATLSVGNPNIQGLCPTGTKVFVAFEGYGLVMASATTPDGGFTTVGAGTDVKDCVFDGQNLYWWMLGGANGGFNRVDKDGGNLTPIPATGTVFVNHLAADATNLYWTDEGGQIATMPKSGGAKIVLVSGLLAPDHIAVSGNNIYWSDVETWAFTMTTK
jgi:hypothetical protein